MTLPEISLIACISDNCHSDWSEMESLLICISLIARDIEHFFIYLLTVFSSSVKCLFSSFAHLLIGLFLFSVFVCLFLSSLYILEINILFEVQVAKIFSHSVGCFLCCEETF